MNFHSMKVNDEFRAHRHLIAIKTNGKVLSVYVHAILPFISFVLDIVTIVIWWRTGR